MRRREFFGACAGAAAATAGVGAGSLTTLAASTPEVTGSSPLLSVMLWTVYRELPFPQRLEKVSEAGYHAVELVGEYKDWSKEDFAAARKKKRELNFEFDATAGVWHTFADSGDREAFLKNVREFIPIMKELECPRLILQSGNKAPSFSAEQMRGNCIEALKRGGEIAAENNIELLVENIDPEENPKYFITSSADGFEIIRAVGNPHVKFLYDFFHEQIAEGNLLEKLEKNIDVIGLVHIADVPGRHAPGTGEINYSNIFRKLAELKYSGYAAMEFIPLGDPVDELRKARELAVEGARSAQKSTAASIEFRRIYASS